MATANSEKPWMRLWKMWQEADALRGLIEFTSQAVRLVIRWLPVAITVSSFVGAVVFAIIASAVAYVLYLPAAAMFIVGLFLSARLLRRETMPIPVDESEASTDMSEEPSPLDETNRPEETPRPRPDREHFIDRFDAAWKIVRVPMRYSFRALNSVFDRPPDEMRALGPYCPSDHTLLKYKDYDGIRSLMDDDDLGRGGSLHCPTCENTFKPDEGYHGKATVEMYRKQLERELNG